jgi:hypothetical protein
MADGPMRSTAAAVPSGAVAAIQAATRSAQLSDTRLMVAATGPSASPREAREATRLAGLRFGSYISYIFPVKLPFAIVNDKAQSIRLSKSDI